MTETDEIVYFEVNNWFCGRDYPNSKFFIECLKDDLKQRFQNDKWCKEQEICVVFCIVDMSYNYNVTAKKSWVFENCPELFDDENKRFICVPEEDCELPDCNLDGYFLEYCPDNFGVHYFENNY